MFASFPRSVVSPHINSQQGVLLRVGGYPSVRNPISSCTFETLREMSLDDYADPCSFAFEERRCSEIQEYDFTFTTFSPSCSLYEEDSTPVADPFSSPSHPSSTSSSPHTLFPSSPLPFNFSSPTDPSPLQPQNSLHLPAPINSTCSSYIHNGWDDHTHNTIQNYNNTNNSAAPISEEDPAQVYLTPRPPHYDGSTGLLVVDCLAPVQNPEWKKVRGSSCFCFCF